MSFWKNARKIGMIASLVGLLAGGAGVGYNQHKLNEISKEEAQRYAPIERALRKEFTKNELTDAIKYHPEKLGPYFAMKHSIDEKYNNERHSENFVNRENYATNRNISGVGAVAGVTGLLGFLLSAEEKKKRKPSVGRAVSVFIGILGLSILLLSSNITGNVIATHQTLMNATGGVLIFLAILFFLVYYIRRRK